MEWLSGMLDGARGLIAATLTLLGAGAASEAPWLQGYAEAEYVRLAAPAAGRVVSLGVSRGDTVRAGDVVFSLDAAAERAARDEAAARLEQAEAQLENLRKGRRTPEIEAIQAQKDQAEADLSLATINLRRQEQLFTSRVIARERLDAARAAYERDRARVAELESQLEVGRLAARDDEIRAAESLADAARAARAAAQWRLDQREISSPVAALVTDTLYRLGEQVPAGSPVVELLPPENIKVRFFVPEPILGRVRLGDAVALRCDGCASGLSARITYIAPTAEFTPPVIFSRDSRDKLVYRVEAKPADRPDRLHPGQPLDVRLVPP